MKPTVAGLCAVTRALALALVLALASLTRCCKQYQEQPATNRRLLGTFYTRQLHTPYKTPHKRKGARWCYSDWSPATCRLRVLSVSRRHKMAEREETLPTSSAALLAHVPHKQREENHRVILTRPWIRPRRPGFLKNTPRLRSQTTLLAEFKQIKRNSSL